jgi:GNAT superfamily N-acetyltransferase
LKSLWAQYQEEMGGARFIEHEWGFVAYFVRDRGIESPHVYVIPERRKEGKARQLLEELEAVAREHKKEYIFGMIKMDSETKTESLIAHLRGGFEPHSTTTDALILRKKVGPLNG